MATKTISAAFPGKKADVLYVEVEKVIRRLGEKFGIQCQYDAARRCIVVPEKMGVKGLCTVTDGQVKVDLEHGMMGTLVANQVKSYVEEKLGKLFT
ncbi:MAG: polyhydroxyalkanoic acid system family protein [Anaeromyxobacter sp.]|nr:polyhydroxyalkanoic acid system family protein [Anaeromyxobacter sp.]MBL0275583.1 polyhydroxyalkanoic acid system family protein [Anaeromyxobacter sp.]